MGSKTPGRASFKAMLGWGSKGREGGSDSHAATNADATVDIGALMRKKKPSLLIPSSNIGGGGLASNRSQQVALALQQLGTSFSGGLEGMAENPIYSPDDSLAKAASKLQSLKALQGSVPRSLIVPPKEHPTAAAPPPAPHTSESQELQERARRATQQAAAVGQRLSSEDSGELAALSALQKRRNLMHSNAAGSAQKRYGSYWQGDEQELENTLREYNRAAPAAAASPRMTRAQRRKSMAVGQSMRLEPEVAEAALEEEHEEEGGQLQQPQHARKAAASRCKSLGGSLQAGAEVQAQGSEMEQVQEQGRECVAAEVAALNAEICGQLEGLVEDSPEKGPRGDGRSLRDKLLESWDGKTYYERLLEMSKEKEDQEAAALQGTQRGRQQRAAQSSKPVRRTGEAKTGSNAGAHAGKPAPPLLQVPLVGGSSAAAAAAKAGLPTPNTQRRKLNELAQSLQLLRVSSRHHSQLPAGEAAPLSTVPSSRPADDARSSPRLQAVVPEAPAAAVGDASQPPSRSSSPDVQAGAASQPSLAAATGRAASEPVGGTAPRTTGKRGRRGVTPPADTSAAGGGATQPQQGSAAAAATADGAVDAELAATREQLHAALTDREALREQLRGAEAAGAAERQGRLAAERELDRLLQELSQSVQAQQHAAAALKAAKQRSRQLAKELAEVQRGAAAAAERVAAVDRAVTERAVEVEARWVEAEKALSNVLKAANAGLRAVASGKEEAKALADSHGGNSCAEDASGTAASDRRSRQSGGRLWR